MSLVKDNFRLHPGGWIPDIPDARDCTLHHSVPWLWDSVSHQGHLSPVVDLTDSDAQWFSRVEHQGSNSMTTAFSCGGLVEYFNRRCHGRTEQVSKKFLHDVACRYHGIPTSSSVSIRQVLKTLTRYGVPPKSCVSSHELTLDPMLYGFSSDYNDLTYVRITAPSTRQGLDSLKLVLTFGLPCVFGMPLSSTLTNDPWIDCRRDEIIGGTSGVLVGYDDGVRVCSQGAFRFRSTWGPQWGEDGYGWLSYRCFENGMVPDVWTIVSPDWIRKGDFILAGR